MRKYEKIQDLKEECKKNQEEIEPNNSEGWYGSDISHLIQLGQMELSGRSGSWSK